MCLCRLQGSGVNRHPRIPEGKKGQLNLRFHFLAKTVIVLQEVLRFSAVDQRFRKQIFGRFIEKL